MLKEATLRTAPSSERLAASHCPARPEHKAAQKLTDVAGTSQPLERAQKIELRLTLRRKVGPQCDDVTFSGLQSM
jgi:hypothetical protein